MTIRKIMRQTLPLLVELICLVLGGFTGNSVLAAAATWNNPATGAAAGAWSTASNWTPFGIPNINSNAKISNGGEAQITSNVSVSRIEVGKNGGVGILTNTTSGVSISTDSDFDIGEIGNVFASGPIVVSGNGVASISNATSLVIGTGGIGDLDIGQTSAKLGAQAHGIGTVTIQNVPLVQIATNVELAKGSGSANALAEGDLQVNGVGTFQVGGDFDVGQVSGSGNNTGIGVASVANTTNLIVGNGIDVGRTSGSSSATNSGDGTLTITDSNASVGFASAALPGSVNIGGTSTLGAESANASGLMTIRRSSINVSDRIRIGELTGGGFNPATSADGRLNLFDSHVSAPFMDVGTVVASTAGTSNAALHLESTLVDISSSMTLGTASSLELGIAGITKADGTGASGQYSTINVGNTALAGILSVELLNGFSPSSGDSYQILSGARTGFFDSVIFPAVPGLSWNITYNPTSVVLDVVADLTADFNNNGTVDGADLVIWQSSYGVGSGADANADGDSDGNDFLLWQQQLTGPAAVSTAVPEPSSVALLGLGLIASIPLKLEGSNLVP